MPQTRYTHDLAISAVSYDALLVTEMTTLLASRLDRSPAWAGDAMPTADGFPGIAVHADTSRIALWQRLWGTDDVTAREAAALRLRARQAPRSVLVVTLDDEALPGWMTRLRRRALGMSGVDAVAEFVLDAIADAGGSVLAKPTRDAPEPPAARWSEQPAPFLAQIRAHSALRRELELLGATLQASVDSGKRHRGDRTWELHTLPNRIVARLDDVGVTFSWLPGRDGTVRDGRLMVIEWTGVATGSGVAALRTARPARERVYRAEANGPEIWSWRLDHVNGRASSTRNLASEWVAGATMAAPGISATAINLAKKTAADPPA